MLVYRYIPVYRLGLVRKDLRYKNSKTMKHCPNLEYKMYYFWLLVSCNIPSHNIFEVLVCLHPMVALVGSSLCLAAPPARDTSEPDSHIVLIITKSILLLLLIIISNLELLYSWPHRVVPYTEEIISRPFVGRNLLWLVW